MITVQQEKLVAALHAVTRASTKSTLMPAFALIKLDISSEGILHLSCFNGETAVKARVQVDCTEELSVCVDAATLKAVVETLVGPLQLHPERNSLVIQCGKNRTALRIVDELIPTLGDEKVEPIATMPGNVFRRLARVLPFASSDESRAVLQVLHLNLEVDCVTAQTADGYSAGLVREAIEGPAKKMTMHLPIQSARLLASLVDDFDILKLGSLSAGHYVFQITNNEIAKDVTLTTVATAENFPSAQIMTLIDEARNNAHAQLQVQKDSLLKSIRMVSAMGTQNTFIKAVGGTIKMASAETESGQSRNILEGSATGKDVNAWASALFLKRAAEGCREELTIKISESKKPILIESGNFTSLIMPMLIEGGTDPFAEDEAISIPLSEMVTA